MKKTLFRYIVSIRQPQKFPDIVPGRTAKGKKEDEQHDKIQIFSRTLECT